MGRFAYLAALTALGLAFTYNYYLTYEYFHVGIDKGILRGFKAITWRGSPYFSFKGIPYAKPPIGQDRFKGPREEPAWAGVRDALSHGNVCPHLDVAFRILRGQEDCLFLNVYTPSLEAERLPVMVWIHGGGFDYGSGNEELYSPDYIVDAGIILVTLNYRLGALGFLSSGDDSAPGNAGLKDQVAALRWVRRNIAKFGGDPENVTLFGESAGGASVNLHLLSPLSAGLFRRAIGQSGSALNTWLISEIGKNVTMRLAKALGAKDINGDTARALKFLKDAPYGDIVKMQLKLATQVEVKNRIKYLFVPCVEKGVQTDEVFLPDYPLNILKSGNFSKVPYITGYTSHEGYLFVHAIRNPDTRNLVIQDTECYVPHDMRNETFKKDLAKSVRKFYFDDKPVGHENISNFVDLYTDLTFATGMNRATKLMLQSKAGPVYHYVFSYHGGLNILKFFFRINDLPGAAHGDDLGYLFYHKLLFWRKPSVDSDDEYIVDTMVRLWTNFAKYGNPTPPGDLLSWKPVTLDEFNYLNISGRDARNDVNPDFERAKFWAEAYDKYEALQN